MRIFATYPPKMHLIQNRLLPKQSAFILRISNNLEGAIMGILTLVLLLALETFFLVWAIKTKNNHREEKAIISIGLLALFALLLITGVYEWSFRYVVFLLVLGIQAIFSAIILVRKREQEYENNN